MDVNEKINQVAFEYGKAVGWREYYGDGHGGQEMFQELDTRCQLLWIKLIALGAYADDEHSVFKDQYRISYLEGLDASPIRPSGYDDEDLWAGWIEDESEWGDEGEDDGS